MKLNCWEKKICGRELGGAKVEELGICPAAVETKLHGINSGKNAGRSCWVIKGTLCDQHVKGNFSRKIDQCLQCGFYFEVRLEESRNYVGSKKLLDILEMNDRDNGESNRAGPRL